MLYVVSRAKQILTSFAFFQKRKNNKALVYHYLLLSAAKMALLKCFSL